MADQQDPPAPSEPLSSNLVEPAETVSAANPKRPSRIWWLFAAGAGIVGIAAVALAVSRYGIGVTQDSAHYIAVARNLAAGKGYVSFDGYRLVSWPPLYPTLLAGLSLAGIRVQLGCWLLNALAFGLIVMLSARLFLRIFSSRALAVVGTACILFSPSLLKCSAMAWTEIVFALLVLLQAAALVDYLDSGRPASFAAACVAAALACLQRYIGLALVPAGIILILLLSRGKPGRRLARATAYAGAALLPIGAWLFRNWVLVGRPAGYHSPAFRPAIAHLETILRSTARWFLPGVETGWISLGLAALVLAATAVALILPSRLQPKGRATQGRVFSAMALSYFIGLAAVSSLVELDLSFRLLVPAFVLALPALAANVNMAVVALGSRLRWPRLVTGIAAVAFCLVLIWPGLDSVRTIRAFATDGVEIGLGPIHHPCWQKLPVTKWLLEHRPQGRVYSNEPAAVYLFADTPARMSPRKGTGSPVPKPGDLLVWFPNVDRPELASPEELGKRLPLEEIISSYDGTVAVFR